MRDVKAAGLTRRLCCLALDDPLAVVLGGEPVTVEGAVVRRVTSGGYGYTLGRSLAYAYLPVGLSAAGTAVQVDLFRGAGRGRPW